VQILAWPYDADRLVALRATRVPRLVTVESIDDAPILDDELEDWILLPADPDELALRRGRLARLARDDVRRRARSGPSDGPPPDTSAPGAVDEVRA